MRNWVVVFLFLGIVGRLPAQSYIGVKLGGQLTTINYDEKAGQQAYEMDQKIGYTGGVVFQHFANKNFALQVELSFVQKGWKTALDTLFNTQYERSINYLNIPFLTHFSFGSENTKLFMQLGFFTGYALTSTELLINTAGSEKRKYVFDPDRDNRIEYGLQGGGGFKRHFGFGTLQVEGNFIFTLNSVYKWGYESTDPELNLYFDIPEQAQNQLIQLTLSYLYPIKAP